MAVQLSAMYPLITPEVPGAPFVLIRKQLLDAAIEFCAKSFIWLETQAAYAITANLADYNFTAAAGETIHMIRSATFDGEPIDPATREFCDANFPGWRPGVTPVITGTPVAITQTSTTGFRLVYTPAVAGSLVLEVAKKPARTATTLPDFLYEEYEEAIVEGALSRMQAMSGEGVTWSNPQLAAAHAVKFQGMIDAANLRQSKGFGRASLRVTPQFL